MPINYKNYENVGTNTMHSISGSLYAKCAFKISSGIIIWNTNAKTACDGINIYNEFTRRIT